MKICPLIFLPWAEGCEIYPKPGAEILPEGLVVGELGFRKSLVSSERVREARQYYMILISVDVDIPLSRLLVLKPPPIVAVTSTAVLQAEA
jgi:hypothetical protein